MTKNPTLLVVWILGSVLLLCLLMIGLLAYQEREPIPDVLIATAAGALSGLLGLLAPRADLTVSQRRADQL